MRRPPVCSQISSAVVCNGPPVGVVVVLVGHEVAIRVLLVDRPRHADRAVAALLRVAVHDLGAVGMDERLALVADVGGHHQLHAIALRRPHHRVGDARVAAGAVDDGAVVGVLSVPYGLWPTVTLIEAFVTLKRAQPRL